MNGFSPPRSLELFTMISFMFLDGRLNPLKTARVGANKMVREPLEDSPDSLESDSSSEMDNPSFEVEVTKGLNRFLGRFEAGVFVDCFFDRVR
jgi:hypothetical protein